MTFGPYELLFFFFNDTATTEIYTLSLHDALPISASFRSPSVSSLSGRSRERPLRARRTSVMYSGFAGMVSRDRKSTRLNSSHSQISYAVFCLKKKKHTISHNMNYPICIVIHEITS